MDKVRRILVYVCKDRAAPQRAQFVQSVTDYFSGEEKEEAHVSCSPEKEEARVSCSPEKEEARVSCSPEKEEARVSCSPEKEEARVSCSLEKNQFLLYRGDEGRGVRLKRPPFCPIKHLSVTEAALIPLDVKQRGVDVGVAILLQSANQRVLLTRRAKELRIFPNVWVPPGGHLEPDETLLEAGLRELEEETGLKLEPDKVSPKVLGLWESAYPPMLSRGLPQRHHIVVYMLLHSSLTHLQLQASLRPAPTEVSACLWADARLVRAIVLAVDGEDAEDQLGDLPSSISVSQVSTEGALDDSSLPLAVFVSRAPDSGPDVERVSTGTKFALDLWLRTLETPDL